MTRRTVALGLLAGALAALGGVMFGTAGGRPAAGPVPANKAVAPVADGTEESAAPRPPRLTVGVLVRPQALLRQLGHTAGDLNEPILRGWLASVGVPLRDVECFEVVLSDGVADVLSLRTTRPINHGRVMIACEAGTAVARRGDLPVYSGPSGLAVHFPEPNLVVIGKDQEALDGWLCTLPDVRERWEEGAKHDLTVWATRTLGKAL